jgi:hypothetical protein
MLFLLRKHEKQLYLHTQWQMSHICIPPHIGRRNYRECSCMSDGPYYSHPGSVNTRQYLELINQSIRINKESDRCEFEITVFH